MLADTCHEALSKLSQVSQVSSHMKQTILPLPRSVTVSIIDVEVSVRKIHALLFILCGMNECFSSDILALIDLQLSP